MQVNEVWLLRGKHAIFQKEEWGKTSQTRFWIHGVIREATDVLGLKEGVP